MSSFSLSGGVEVLGFISPTDSLDTYAVIDPLYGVDGFRNVNSLSDLDLIPEPRRRAGMVVGVSGGTSYYKLNTSPWNYNFADWSVFNTGGSTSGNYLPLSGGTVTGSTTFTSGLFSNTISATTYQNLPTDVRVTGGTYSNGTATFSNNSGGTFNVSGFYTGSTDNNQFVTGYTYLDNTFTIADNSGSTFNATINTMTGLTINGNLDVTTIDEVDTIDFNLSPTGTNGIGRLRWNNTDGTLDLGLKGGNVTLQVGQETVVRVVNKTGTLIPNGSVVRVVQVAGGVTGIALSLGDNDLNSAGTIGITTEDIADNAQGFVTIQGLVHELNTNAFTEGDVLYLSPTIPGGITNVKPIAPQHMVIVGYCVKKGITDGHILLHVQNGYELEELHNVQITGTTKGGSLLEYNTSTSVWSDSPIVWTIELINALSVDVYAPYNLSIDTVTNILNAPTITIYDDNVVYTLGNTIAIGSKITVVASVIGVTNLTLSKI